MGLFDALAYGLKLYKNHIEIRTANVSIDSNLKDEIDLQIF